MEGRDPWKDTWALLGATEVKYHPGSESHDSPGFLHGSINLGFAVNLLEDRLHLFSAYT